MASPGLPTPPPGLGDARVGAVFGALADPTRRHLIQALAHEPGATATGLAADAADQPPGGRQAPAPARPRRPRPSRRSGREARFELEAGALTEAAAWIGAVGAEWDDRLGRLQRLL